MQVNYRREFLDAERTNVVEHLLQFECKAEDCGQPAANPTEYRLVEDEEVFRKID